MSKEQLKNIMSSAWAIFKEGVLTFSEALRQSWKSFKLSRKMKKGSVKFSFTKKDGTIRQAIGTLKDVQSHIKGTGNAKTLSVQVYYDLEKKAFRSFKKGGLV